jgi:hypothetical protein
VRTTRSASPNGQGLHRGQVAPPGQSIKVIAKTPRALRAGSPGIVAKATLAPTPAARPSTPAATRSQKSVRQATGQAQPQSKAQADRATPTHPAPAQAAAEAKAKPKPEHPATPPVSNGRQTTTTETVPDPGKPSKP